MRPRGSNTGVDRRFQRNRSGWKPPCSAPRILWIPHSRELLIQPGQFLVFRIFHLIIEPDDFFLTGFQIQFPRQDIFSSLYFKITDSALKIQHILKNRGAIYISNEKRAWKGNNISGKKLMRPMSQDRLGFIFH